MSDAENTLLIELKDGTVEAALLPDVAPEHVARIKELARAGKYDNVVFHRVIDGFMAQTGDVENGNTEVSYNPGRAGTGGSDLPNLPAEFSKLPFDRGVIGMARSQNPNSGNSQFFIMFDDGHFSEWPVHGLWPGDQGYGACRQDYAGRAACESGQDAVRENCRRRMMIRRTFLKIVTALVFAAAPVFAADPEDTLVVEIGGSTTGTVEIELLPDVAPGHVARIKELARAGKYDNVVFHRVIDGFMAQTGDVQFGTRDAFSQGRAGMGGSDMPDLVAEFSAEPHIEGVVSMARAQNPNSANSQFFIVFGDATFLDNQYTVFGRVTSGMDVVHSIKKGDRNANGAVQDPDYMVSVRVKSDL